ncbi:MAG: hypothetical protein VYC34_00940 [Planctomycetota bacterium]|nr:hypothetical protein [Planctomycetota bacterium]
MAKTRQILLVGPARGDGDSSESEPLGTKREVLKALSKRNTAPDGSKDGFGVAYGPGIRVELPFVDDRDDVMQVMVAIIEEELAWPVLQRLCKEMRWRLLDPTSGRVFGA